VVDNAVLREPIGDRCGRVAAMMARNDADWLDNLNESEQVVNIDQFIGAALALLWPPSGPRALVRAGPHEAVRGHQRRVRRWSPRPRKPRKPRKTSGGAPVA
jgi:hypothetical protein